MKKRVSWMLATALIAQQVVIAPAFAADFGTMTNETVQTVSPDVLHKTRGYESGTVKRAVHILDVNLNNPHTKIEMGISNPINTLTRTSKLASQYNYEGHRVVGAINAAYFNSDKFPSTLIAMNNEILNFGAMGTNPDSPTQKPVAFGIGKDGKAIADYYNLDFTYEINGKTYKFDRVNSTRSENNTVVYTERQKTTGTNVYGREIIVENASQSTKNLKFGDVVTGTVKAVTAAENEGNSAIPENGFVISANGTGINAAFDEVQPGDEVTIRVGIDAKWQDAQFIMAAGPLLVNNGQVDLSMPADQPFARDRHPRTAIGIDATGSKLFFVTVDGRQSGYSLGSSLKDLGDYMISLGATQAINLDGGGSTTMVVRELGTNNLPVVNKPSNGSEIAVSAILQIINTAPQGTAKAVTLNARSSTVMVGDSYQMKVKSAYDEYFNPLTVNATDVTWTVEGDIGYMDGVKFIATKSGTGKIIGTYGGARVELPMSVLEMPDKPYLLNSFDNTSEWSSSSVRGTSNIATNSMYAREGVNAIALSYNFVNNETQTKAAYMDAKKTIQVFGKPDHLGVWVFGDGNRNWVRGVVKDANGAAHTIDFTQNEQSWSGWKYMQASLPANVEGPFTFERIYIANTKADSISGTLYFDQLQAVYSSTHVEAIYKDVDASHWALPAITKLNTEGLIKGYTYGTFEPEKNITRADAAMILSRMVDVPVTKQTEFKDVAADHYAYAAIQEAAAAGIINGRGEGKFEPNGNLTRVEMAAMMARMYKLEGDGAMPFNDVKKSYWGYESVRLLAVNNYINGYEDGTFKPDKEIKRAEFAQILSKTMK